MKSLVNFSSTQVLHADAGYDKTGNPRLLRITRELSFNGIFEVTKVEQVEKVEEISGVANIAVLFPIQVSIYNQIIADGGIEVAKQLFNIRKESSIVDDSFLTEGDTP